MFFKEFLLSIKNYKIMSIVIVLIFSVGLLFMNISIIQIKEDKIINEELNKDTKKYYFRLSDNYISNKEVEFRKEVDALEKLKELSILFNESTYFNYLEVSTQSLYVNNFKGNDTFFYNYEYGMQQEPISLDGRLYSNVKSIQLSDSVFNEFDVEIARGRKFNEQDYIYNDNIPISVLLGNEYNLIYKLDDVFYIDYLGLRTKAKVIGFLKKDSSIINQNDLMYLDRYIIMPSLKFENTPTDVAFGEVQYRVYLNKVNGIIISDELARKDIQKIINSYTEKVSVEKFSVIGTDNNKLKILLNQANEYTSLYFLISIIICLFSTISLIVSLLNKIRKNLITYAIHLMNGANKYQLMSFVIIEILFYMILANIISVTISYFILGYLKYSIIVPITSIVIVFCSSLVLIKKINAINISRLLREAYNDRN